MITLGNEDGFALRVTMGRLTSRGEWRGWQPCIFWIVGGRRHDFPWPSFHTRPEGTDGR